MGFENNNRHLPLAKDGTRDEPLRRYYVSLDALRLVLFGLIILAHCYIDPPLLAGHDLLIAVYRLGWTGVQGFFVLSAFIITTLLLGEGDRTGRIDRLDFYRRRFLKIMPPLITVVIVYLVVIQTNWLHVDGLWNSLPLAGSKEHDDTLANLPLFIGLIGNIPYALGMIAPLTPALLIIWTLCIEEQFYLIFPLVFGFLNKNKRWSMLAILLAILINWLVRGATIHYMQSSGFDNATIWRIVYTFTPLQLDAIFFGILAALVHDAGIYRKFSSGARVILILAVVALTIMWAVSWNIVDEPIRYNLIGLVNLSFGLIVILLAEHDEWIRKSAIVRGMSRHGRNGYCLYLTHHGALILAFMMTRALQPFLANEPLISFLVRLVIAFLLSLILAKGLYWIGERPWQRFRKTRPVRYTV